MITQAFSSFQEGKQDSRISNSIHDTEIILLHSSNEFSFELLPFSKKKIALNLRDKMKGQEQLRISEYAHMRSFRS